MAQQAILNDTINYHNRAAVKHQGKIDSHKRMFDWHIQEAIIARQELVRIQREALIPPTVEYKDILGNLVARGTYVLATNEYVTNHDVKVAHWNAKLGIIVAVASVRSRIRTQNIRADPVAHERVKEQQRERYRVAHPVVQKANRFLD